MRVLGVRPGSVSAHILVQSSVREGQGVPKKHGSHNSSIPGTPRGWATAPAPAPAPAPARTTARHSAVRTVPDRPMAIDCSWTLPALQIVSSCFSLSVNAGSVDPSTAIDKFSLICVVVLEFFFFLNILRRLGGPRARFLAKFSHNSLSPAPRVHVRGPKVLLLTQPGSNLSLY